MSEQEVFEQYDLPPGWAWCAVRDIVASITDGPFGSSLKTSDYVDDRQGVRVIRLGNIGTGEFLDDDQSFVSAEKFSSLAKHEATMGDIVIAALAEPVGRACIVPGHLGRALVKADCVRARIVTDVSTALVMRWLNSPQGLRSAALSSHGIGRLRINLGEIRALPVPLPPAPEQRRIVAKLDAIFEQTRAAKARLERLPALLEKLKRSILAAAFRGDLTKDWRADHPNIEPATVLLDRIHTERRRFWEDSLRARGKDPRKTTYETPVGVNHLDGVTPGWCWTSLGAISRLITSGSRGWADYYSESGQRFIRSQDINMDFLRLDDAVHVNVPDSIEGARTRVERADILITITGANVTRCARVIDDPGEAYVSQHVALVRPVPSVDDEYLHLWIISEDGGRGQLKQASYGLGKPGLNLTDIANVQVPIAPAFEQREIARRVEAALAIVARMEDRVRSAAKSIRAIEQAALSMAFRGKLVPQDPTDEPAARLLERIRTARPTAGTAPRSGRALTRTEHVPATAPINGHATVLGEDPLDLVIAAVQHGMPRLGATAIAQATGLDASAVKKALSTLVDSGQVRVHGRARGTTYEWSG